MPLTCDWHIHSRNSCDEASLSVGDLIVQAAGLGILDFGLTDHIHTPYNLPDLEASRREFLASNPPPRFHFGVEVSVVSEWELAELAAGDYGSPVYGLRQGGPPGAEPAIGIGEEDLRRLGVEYVVGGTHWPLYVPPEREAIIRDYHRQNLFLATHPLVDIVAHPWWWMGHWRSHDGRYLGDPWLDDFGKIPGSMHEEFAAAAVQHGKVVEINISAMLLNHNYPTTFPAQYLEYVADLKARGVCLCLGSDCHSARYAIDFDTTARMLESVGLRDEDLWRLPPRAE
jgi:histidinol phosphatase-like PHP family hydrolase